MSLEHDHERRRSSRPSVRPRPRRVSFDSFVDVLANGYRFRARLVNLSISGMAIELPPSLAEREPPLIGAYEILAGGAGVHVVGRTVRREGALRAVRFVGAADFDRELIGLLVEDAVREGAGDVERLEMAEMKDALASEERRLAA